MPIKLYPLIKQIIPRPFALPLNVRTQCPQILVYSPWLPFYLGMQGHSKLNPQAWYIT